MKKGKYAKLTRGVCRASLVESAVVGAVALVWTGPARGGDVVSTWKPNTSGNWSDAFNWTNASETFAYPDNGVLGNTYDVVIGPGSTGASISFDLNVTVRNLSLDGRT